MNHMSMDILNVTIGDVPVGPVVKISPSNARGWVRPLMVKLRSYMLPIKKPKHKTEVIL